jgi:pimeloyl-ACP methyl ester carboxylesterase
MPIANIRGANINYEVLGDSGPWVSITPGGRRDGDAVRYLGERIAARGFRVLLHDRRNTGASDVVLEGIDPEYVIWADDLHELLGQLGASPAFVGGTSAGCRLALLTYLRHPYDVQGLLLWRVTGGRFAAERLAQQYYGQYIEMAKSGGMQAVADSEHFAERIAANPANRDVILSTSVVTFMRDFGGWRQGFLDDADLPVIGATEDALRGISVPTCIVPGNDLTHPRAVGENAARLIPDAECHVLLPTERDLDVSPPEDLEAVAVDHARIYVDFMLKHAAVGAD